MGKYRQVWKSASSGTQIGGGFESLLLLPGLEQKVTREELERVVCDNASASLVEQLGEYAALFKGSRELIVCAFDACIRKQCVEQTARRIRAVRDEILALSMLESLYGCSDEK
ncbi:MAG: hypothetical protein KGH59_03360 [Candidatus Micrarchaeota archaeon]|nr:hypothetical protein [Candidatus Micrarchaeota archaeon]MDE1847187.1 hypothetical protein [Candidatus Micrarchaeota archaeon]